MPEHFRRQPEEPASAPSAGAELPGAGSPGELGRFSGAAAARPVIWTVSVSRLSTLLRDVTPEFDARAKIEPIALGFEEAVTEIRRRLDHSPCDVIIAAGSNGAYLRHRVPRPVMLIRPAGFDLMQALTQARRISPLIGVITHQSEIPVFSAFQDSFGLQIEQRAFVTAEEARQAVAELASTGVRVVIGTGIVVDFAEQAGIAGILLYSADSIRATFESAIDLARMIAMAAERPEVRKPVSRPAMRSHQARLADVIGTSEPARRLRNDIALCAASDATVLIYGATGSGKELAAQAVHTQSQRRSGPFVAVNCGAIAESLLESELFGYDEGSFTGARRGGRAGLVESAEGGTLFLDEIGEMPLALQTRLLRVIEEREVVRVGASRPIPVDIRILVATHCDLAAMTAVGNFRRDLFYRLNVLRIRVPDLAERPDDVDALADFFLREALAAGARPQFAPEVLACLRMYAWPGNVRELRNIVQRLAAHWQFTGGNAAIDLALLKHCAPELYSAIRVDAREGAASRDRLVLNSDSAPIAEWGVAPPLRSGRRTRPDREALARVLARVNGDRRSAGALLGVSRATLWRWIKDAGL